MFAENAPAMFSKTLREMRERRNWTQKDLAERVGCLPSTVNNWENTRPNVTIYYLVRIADAFGVSLDEMAGRK